MRMTASATAHSFGYLQCCVRPERPRRPRFAAPGQKMRHGAATECSILAPQLGFKKSVTAEKENRAPQFRAPALLSFEPMCGNQQIVGVLEAEHLYAYEFVAHDDSVHAVREKVLDSLQPGNCATVHTDEADVVPQEFHRAPRFLATNLPCFRPLLEDDVQLRPAADAGLPDLLQSLCGQRQSAPRDRSKPTLLHVHLLGLAIGLLGN